MAIIISDAGTSAGTRQRRKTEQPKNIDQAIQMHANVIDKSTGPAPERGNGRPIENAIARSHIAVSTPSDDTRSYSNKGYAGTGGAIPTTDIGAAVRRPPTKRN